MARVIHEGAQVFKMKISFDSTYDLPRSVDVGISFDFLFESVPAIAKNRNVLVTARAMRDEVAFVLSQFEALPKAK